MEDSLSIDEIEFWQKWPDLLSLYEALRNELTDRYPDLRIKVSKTQISFYNRHMFAMVSGPWRRKKGWPRSFMMVSFGLDHKVLAPEIIQSTEPYPNRWTHHVLITSPDQISEQLLAWIDESWHFSLTK